MTSFPTTEAAPDPVARLDRLEAYLLGDPDNETLLAEAFSLALRCAAWTRAESHLRHAQVLWPDSLAWALRGAEYWLARGEMQRASELLAGLQALPNQPPAFTDTVLHNLAFIDFQAGRYAACVARLAQRMEAPNASGTLGAMDVLWLRALHHAGEPERATRWASQREQRSALNGRAAGVASLAALDAGQSAEASRWSLQDFAEDQAMPTTEALVTQSSLALAEADAAKARNFAMVALNRQPSDGRARSALAFAELLEGNLREAVAQFDGALQAMPSHIGTWHGLGWAQLMMNDLEGAQASFEKALELDRNFAESHGGLAVVLAMKQNAPAAQLHIDKAMRLDGTNLSGRFAQSMLRGETAPAQFSRLAERLLAGKTAPNGSSLLAVVMNALRSSR
ncbi:tetratricopeptide repeat protein [Acidovorax sp. GBBC 3334]|uniref:tetratricopeptide repeat protein n=1 Tax=Acidovorax sp. GBBC 3334 TaxID=2940496 RepID=UPI002303ED73|nr:tetratricopeptide repeat protein [Acidovorax sp. GBBC 3334]MDA8456970.1 tetratricopeptide repeat protein [Acidovorax sp. GBBC 3334]